MAFDSPCCNVTSSLTLWAFSCTLFFLLWVMWNLFLCSLDYHSMYYNWSILFLMWAKFAKISFCEEFVDYSPCFFFPALLYLIIIHMVLVQKRERGFVSQCFGYDPCLLRHGVHSPYRHDLHLDVLPLLWDEFLWWSTFFLLWNMSSEPYLFVGFLVLRGFSWAEFSISYSSLKCLISCSPFRALKIA
jgi:hypothetical protein